MHVTRSLETLWGVHLAAGLFGAAAYGHGHGRVLGDATHRALSGHFPAVGIENN